MEFLIIDDDRTFRDATCFLIEDDGHLAEGAPTGRMGLERLREDRFDAVLLDVNLGAENGLDVLVEMQQRHPLIPVVVFSAQGDIRTAVEAMRRGATDFLEKPFLREQFHAVLARLQKVRNLGQRIERLEREVTEIGTQQVEPIFDFAVPVMREVMEVLTRAAATPASVLILGESGTGKSVAARAVHQKSHLAERPFVTVSCPSLSKELLESELFGHVKGAFTGALRDHWGKVKAAEGGTLFLDEIGDLPPEIQPKLLRLLQEREYERLGENTTRRAEVRIIAATNRDLRKRVAEGAFREDLFFRLNVIAVTMPPLRERHGDLLRFADHYLKFFAAQCGRRLTGFSPEAQSRLAAHPWPGNLRELRNAVERAAILTRGEQIEEGDLPLEARASGPGVSDGMGPVAGGAEANARVPLSRPGERVTLEALETSHIRMILAQASSLVEAAEILGIDQATLYRKRKKLGLDASGAPQTEPVGG
ncbi:MAG: sigma-54-dependent Fis family transcriptional regulator [Verrucomicrobiales bacterium]|nr:sigma-54-dependent Fis family transcriptional regulator [Verrucomicrobiales bacterium]